MQVIMAHSHLNFEIFIPKQAFVRMFEFKNMHDHPQKPSKTDIENIEKQRL